MLFLYNLRHRLFLQRILFVVVAAIACQTDQSWWWSRARGDFFSTDGPTSSYRRITCFTTRLVRHCWTAERILVSAGGRLSWACSSFQTRCHSRTGTRGKSAGPRWYCQTLLFSLWLLTVEMDFIFFCVCVCSRFWRHRSKGSFDELLQRYGCRRSCWLTASPVHFSKVDSSDNSFAATSWIRQLLRGFFSIHRWCDQQT